MRFKDYIYIDERLVESFAGQIGLGFSNADVVERDEKTLAASGGIAPLAKGNGEYSSERIKTSKIAYTPQQKFDLFEKALAERGSIRDLDDSAKAILEGVEKESIIRASGIISYPELTENLAGFTALKSYVKDESLAKMLAGAEEGADGLDVEAIFRSLTNPSQTVPAIIDAAGFSIVVELKRDGAMAGWDIADLADEEVSLIGRVKKVVESHDELEVVDPYKLLGIGRGIRRKIANGNQQMVETVKGPALRVQPLALWG